MFQIDPGLRDGGITASGEVADSFAAVPDARRSYVHLYRRSKRQKDSPGEWPGEGQEKTTGGSWGQHQAPVSALTN